MKKNAASPPIKDRNQSNISENLPDIVHKLRYKLGQMRIRKLVLGALLLGMLGGFLLLAAIRFVAVRPEETHYHANFAVYINGEREAFKSFTYYEEIAACSSAYSNNPKGRTHLHNSVNAVIHVHDKRVTYANFFENIDWHIGKDFIQTDAGMFQSSADKKVMYLLNGEIVDRVDNMVIGGQDKLLISYGSSATEAEAQYMTIANKAESFDSTNDPASCAGLNGADHHSFRARLNRSFFGN